MCIRKRLGARRKNEEFWDGIEVNWAFWHILVRWYGTPFYVYDVTSVIHLLTIAYPVLCYCSFLRFSVNMATFIIQKYQSISFTSLESIFLEFPFAIPSWPTTTTITTMVGRNGKKQLKIQLLNMFRFML